jgi:hypothetical protein
VSPNCRDKVGVGSYKVETYPDNSVNGCKTGSSYDQIIFATAVTNPSGYAHLYLTNTSNVRLSWHEERNIRLSRGGTDKNPLNVTPQAPSGATGEFDIEVYHSTNTKYPSDNYFSNHSPSDRIPVKIDII